MMNLSILLLGLFMVFRLPVRELPDIDPPIISVQTVYPGANARVVETEVTEKLEDVINGVEGIRTLTSESREEFSSITVEFTLARPIDLAAQDVRDRVSRIRSELPDDIDDPIVAKQDSDARPMLWVALYGERYTTQELTDIGERLLKEPLQTVSGVSSVIFGGEKRFAVRIRLDSKKLAAHGVTVLDVEQALRTQNIELPSGRVENLGREFIIQTLGEVKKPEAFEQIVLRSDGDSLVRIRDVGLAEAGVEDERSVARYRSRPAVGLGVIKQSQSNTLEVAAGVKAELNLRKASLPPGVEVFVAYDESIFVDRSIKQVWSTLFIAFGLVVLIIFLFLANIRSTLIPALSIPISILATFVVLGTLGYSINILTMLGLVLAIGIVVDDSIVVLENIYHHIEQGLEARAAAIKGIGEITFAVIATTVVLLAVFIPLAFQTSIVGQLFVEFAAALSGAVVISSFVALTLVPMVCARLLKKSEPSGILAWFQGILDRVASSYERLLAHTLRRRKTALSFTVLALIATGYLYTLLEKEFLPIEDKGRLFAPLIAPEGATAEYTNEMLMKMEQIIADVPEVAGYFSAVALPFNGPGKGNEGLMFVRFKEKRDRRVQDILAGPKGVGARFFSEIEGAFAIPIMPRSIGGGFAQPFQLVLQNQDIERLDAVGKSLAGKLRSFPFLSNVRPNFQLNKPELQIEIDRDRAASLGVSIEDISRTLQILFGGLDLSSIKRDGKEYEVMVQLSRDARLTPGDLDALYVRNEEGRLIQLPTLVNYKTLGGPNAIRRYNRARSVTIEATPVDAPLGTIIDQVEALLERELPPDFRYEWAGEARDLKEASADSIIVLVFAITVVYMVLAAQFESLRHPITVMLAIPLGGLGSLSGLWLMNQVNLLGEGLYGWANYAPDPPWFASVLSAIVPRIPSMTINVYSQIGILLMIGLVTKNSILLVDFANQLRARGKGAYEAIQEAGKRRLRPILMTALGTIFGILPIAIGLGAGAESRRGMGVAVVSGMLLSTFLTLFIIPVVYTFLETDNESR